jgi:hypothetical protein
MSQDASDVHAVGIRGSWWLSQAGGSLESSPVAVRGQRRPGCQRGVEAGDVLTQPRDGPVGVPLARLLDLGRIRGAGSDTKATALG